MSLNTTMPSIYPDLYLHVGGERLSASGRQTMEIRNPATGEKLGDLPLATTVDLDRALETARSAFTSWRQSTPEQRSRVLRGAAQLLRERIDVISAVATLEEGKTTLETRLEVLGSAGLFEFYAEECQRAYGRVLVRPTGSRVLVMKEPVGPVAAFAPWNFPLHNPARKLGAPIAAGCSVILKPAEEAPASALAVLQALIDAGLPAGVAQVVFGIPDQVSRHLLASDTIRKLSFTGSTSVGTHLMKLAANTCKRTTMELGGHAPVLVFNDADLAHAVETLAVAKHRNAGQVCVSPTRFYIQEGIYAEFVRRYVERVGQLRVGDGSDPTSEMGPLAHPRRIQALQALIADARAQGACVLCGGEPLPGPGLFFAPTVLADVPNTARIMNEEPFGPVTLLARFSSFEEGIAEANRLPFGLAAYAFTTSAQTVMRVGDAFESGMVGINVARLAAPDAPFCGVKHSGHGAEDGKEGFEACLVTKTIHQA